MFSSTYNGEFEDVKAVHDGLGAPLLYCTLASTVTCHDSIAELGRAG